MVIYITLCEKKYTVINEIGGTVRYLDGSTTKITSINNVTVYDSTPSEAAMKSKQLADQFVNALSSLGVANRESRDHNLYVTRWTKMPSVLIEMGFISNPSEINKISNPLYQDRAVEKMVKVICDFFNNK